jgi:hypothetical protein
VFQRGNDRPTHTRALPDLERFYDQIRRGSSVPFDPKKAAALELEWWIIHRQQWKYTRQDLENALAELQAAIFMQPVETVREHARLRAEAMLLRDDRAGHGGLSSDHWNRIADMLDRSWVSLQPAVRAR